MSPASPLKLLLLAVLAGQAGGALAFTPRLPESVPSVEGWERVDGEAEFANPSFSVRYEFYVRPGRLASYEVVRYRFAGAGAEKYGHTERLQWDVNGRRLHRFECRPTPSSGRGCEWQEMARDGEAFRQETWVLLWLYSLHRRLLEDRDGTAPLPPPP